MRNKLLAIVGVIAVFAMTGSASAQNLLVDGNFELGTGWTPWSWNTGFANFTVNVFDDGNTVSWTNGGNGTLLLNVGNSWYDGGGGAYQLVAATPGEDYQLSVACGAVDWWLPTGQMALIWMDSSQTNALGTNSMFTVDPAVYGTGAYDVPHPMANYSMIATAPAGTAFVQVEFSSRMPGGVGGSITFDNALLQIYNPIVDDDADGLPNVWENTYGLDPNDATGVNGASGDPDGDGLLNIDEYNNGSSPILSDTDGDGLNDYQEVITYGTNPAKVDTDGDTLSDFKEVNTYGTDPTLADTDSDGENDGFELFQNTDPLDVGSSSAALGIPTVDGTLDAAFYGAALAVQTSETSGTDTLGAGTNLVYDGTELDAAYSVTKNGKLYLMVTGNVSNDWGMVNIYIDSTPAVTANVLDTAGMGNPEIVAQNGMIFDAGFGPDYHLYTRASYDAGWNYSYVSFTKLATKTESQYSVATTNASLNVNYRTGTGVNAHSIGVAFDNSNTNGVIAGTGAANQVDAAAVTTGLELAINLADIGNPTGLVRVVVIAADAGNATLLNQVLAGVPPQGSLGGSVDFSNIAGDQFFDALDASLDTDGDGMPDLWEESFGLDPFDATGVNGAAGDLDADGLSNIDELLNGTSPANPDTDGDGLNDGDEVSTYGTEPLVWDTDGDGLNDGDEVNIHGTNPLLADSDSDGEDDWFELFQGTDPLDAGSSSAALGLAVVDGSLDVAAYGAAVATQTVNTAWEDNLDELDAAYARIQNGRLYLMLTGNMNTNWNSVEIFIDSSAAVTTNVFTAQGADNTASMNGLVFDAGFSPDYHVNARLGTWEGHTNALGGADWDWNLDFMDLGTGQLSYQNDAFGELAEGIRYMGAGDANTNSPIAIGFTNSNIAGVVVGTGAANQANALAVSTGLELSIALADLGNPVGEIRIMAMVTGSNTNTGDHSITCNQVLPGLAAPQAELGATSNVNFSVISGDQFFTVNIPLAVAAEILSGQLISGNTLFQLNVSKLVAGVDYQVRETTDLTAAFSDVGAPWTAASTNEVKTVPADTVANPVMFYQVIAP